MSVAYKINNVEPMGSDLVKITFQYTPFDSTIVETINLPSIFTDAEVKQYISNQINATHITPTAPPADPDAEIIAIGALRGGTYVTTTHP